jgi:hypothetical protein
MRPWVWTTIAAAVTIPLAYLGIAVFAWNQILLLAIAGGVAGLAGAYAEISAEKAKGERGQGD